MLANETVCVLLRAAVYVYLRRGGLAACECGHNECVCESHNGGYYSNEVPGCLDTYCSPPVPHFPCDRGLCANV